MIEVTEPKEMAPQGPKAFDLYKDSDDKHYMLIHDYHTPGRDWVAIALPPFEDVHGYVNKWCYPQETAEAAVKDLTRLPAGSVAKITQE